MLHREGRLQHSWRMLEPSTTLVVAVLPRHPDELAEETRLLLEFDLSRSI